MKSLIKSHIESLKVDRERCISYKSELEGYHCEETAVYQLNNLGISVVEFKIAFWSFFV